MVEFEWYIYLILVGVGVVAGVINALAGNGSALTLTALIFFGMPATIANATNRVGVFLLALTVVLSLKRTPATLRLYRSNASLMLPAVIGSGIGAWGATMVNDDFLRYVATGALFVILLTMVFQNNKWQRPDIIPQKGDSFSSWTTILLAGFYAGFIQMGVGIMLLAVLVLISKYSFQQANLLKQIITFALATVPLLIFIQADMVEWTAGLALGVGQVAGGRAAARLALENPKAQVWIRRLVIAIIVLALAGLLNLHTYIWEWVSSRLL